MEFEKEIEILNINRIEISSISDLDIEYIQKHYPKPTNLELSFNMSIYDENAVMRMNALINEVQACGYSVSTVLIKADNKRFTVSDMIQFSLFEKELKENNLNLRFDGGLSQSYEISDVIVAQTKLNNFIDGIKEQEQLSQFEKYLLIYDFLTRKVYKENEQNKSKARDIIALMNGDDIVCVGYAQLMEYVCRAVGIKCYTQNCKVYSPNEKYMYNHQNNLVYIDDDKYNIHGMFYSDACWDHVDKGYENKRTYAFCLVPLEDKDNINKKIKIDDDTMFFYPNQEYMLKLVDGEYYGSVFGKNYDGEYSKIIKAMGLEEKYNITESMVKDVCQNRLRRKYACEELKNIFKQERVPADIYRSKSSVPYGTSFEFLLSLYMFNEIDKDFVVDRIKELKRYYSSSKRLDISDSARSYVYDVYEELDSLKAEASQDVIFENDVDDVKWEAVESKVTKTIMAGLVYNNLINEKTIQPGKPISIDSYLKALPRVYECQGYDKNEIKEMMEISMRSTKRVSNKAYNENANNCFKKEAMKELAIETQFSQ